MRRLEVRASHLYPGAEGALTGAGDDVEVEFSDGTTVFAALQGDRLAVPAYITAAGTAIDAKVWTVTFRAEGLRVTARAG